LETVERVLEDLLSTKMGVENIDQIIEEVVREKESSGKTFTRDEILQSIDDRVMKKKAGPAVPSDSPSPSSSSPPSSSSSSSSSSTPTPSSSSSSSSSSAPTSQD